MKYSYMLLLVGFLCMVMGIIRQDGFIFVLGVIVYILYFIVIIMFQFLLIADALIYLICRKNDKEK